MRTPRSAVSNTRRQDYRAREAWSLPWHSVVGAHLEGFGVSQPTKCLQIALHDYLWTWHTRSQVCSHRVFDGGQPDHFSALSRNEDRSRYDASYVYSA